jgi:hypothetical protein
LDLDLRVERMKVSQATNQPPRGQRRSSTHAQLLPGSATTQAWLQARNPVEERRQLTVQFRAVIAQFDPRVEPFQKLYAEEVFEAA